MFDDMKQPVTLLFFTQAIECETCDETKRILAELTDVTDKIVVEEVNLVLDKERAATYGIERAPALVLLTEGQDTRIRFFGARLATSTMATPLAAFLAVFLAAFAARSFLLFLRVKGAMRKVYPNQNAARTLGATCFFRDITPGRSITPSLTSVPNALSSEAVSPST